MNKLQGRIDELERDLSLLEPVYLRAKARLSGEDQEWAQRREIMIQAICTMITKFSIEDKPSKAVAILSQLVPRAEELTAPRKIVEDYERKTEMLRVHQQEEDRRKSAEEGARTALNQMSWRHSA
jgi:hypothetical protein